MEDDFRPLEEVAQAEDGFRPLDGPANIAIGKTASTPQGQKSAFDVIQETRYPNGKPTSILSRVHELAGGNTGIGATGAALVANAMGPQTGGMSILIPALAAALGGAAGAATEGKSPLGEGAKEGALQGVFGGAAKVAPAIKKLGEDALVKMFATRQNAAQAGEDLLKRKFMTGPSASSMYKEGENLAQFVAPQKTMQAIDDALGQEGFQVAGKTSQEIVDLLKPFERFYQPFNGMKVAQPVSDIMTEIRRLGLEARTTKNPDVMKAAYGVREAMIQDLENHGAGIVREAGKQARREAAFEKLASMIAKSEPLTKIAELERKDSLFKGAFTQPGEKEEIDRIVKKIATVAPTGGAGVIGRGMSWLLGATLGAPAGMTGHVLGGLAGEIGSEYLRTLLASPKGRAYLSRVLDAELKMGTNRIAGNAGAAGAMLARGLTAAPPEEKPVQTEY